MIYFGADLHLGHKNIHKHRPQWDTPEEHDQYVLDMVSGFVGKNTPLYLLGDICFTKDAINSLAKLNTYSNFKIILGNHDIERGVKIGDWVNAGFKDVYSLLKYKEFYLSHCPIHPDELRGKINIHGHSHSYRIEDDRYVCVSLEQTEYKLIGIEELRSNL